MFEGGTGRLERIGIKESGQSWTCNPGALAASIRDSPDFKSSTTLVNSQFRFASVQLGFQTFSCLISFNPLLGPTAQFRCYNYCMLIVLSLLILGSSSGWFSSLNVSKDASFQVKKVHE